MQTSLIRTTRLVAENGLYLPVASSGGGGGGITQLTGDVTAGPGSGSQAATVARVNGATVPAAGALTTGNVLQVSGVNALSYGPLNLVLAASVTGILGVAHGGSGLGAVGANGTVLTVVAGAPTWAAPAASGITQLTNDVLAGPGTGSQSTTVVQLTGGSGGSLVTVPTASLAFGTNSAQTGYLRFPNAADAIITTRNPTNLADWNILYVDGPGNVLLNSPVNTLGVALHLQVDGADFIELGSTNGATPQIALGIQNGTNYVFGGNLYSYSFGVGSGIVGLVNANHNLPSDSSGPGGIGFLWTDTRTDGQPEGLVFLGDGRGGSFGMGARSAIAPVGRGQIATQAGDEVCDRAYGRTTIGSTDTTTATIPLENGSLNGQVRFTGRLVTPGGGGGTTGDSFFATYNIRIKTIAGVVTVAYFTIDGAGTAGSDTSMLGALFTATASGAAVALEIDATGIASGAGSIEDWQTDCFKVFVN
jgi:hypothetical protein